MPEDQSNESTKSSNIGNGIQLTIILSCFGYTLWEVWQIRWHSQRAIQENTYSSSNLSQRFYENCQVCKCGYKCVNTLTQLGYTLDLEAEAGLISTTSSATERTLVAIQARSLTTERQPVNYQRMACLQSSNSWELLIAFASNTEESNKLKNLESPFKEGHHPIWTLEKFKSLKVNGQREHVQKFRLYFNCLTPDHMS